MSNKKDPAICHDVFICEISNLADYARKPPEVEAGQAHTLHKSFIINGLWKFRNVGLGADKKEGSPKRPPLAAQRAPVRIVKAAFIERSPHGCPL